MMHAPARCTGLGRQPIPGTADPLAKLLSHREAEVMRIIADGLSNREVSERLFITLDTIKGHNRRISSVRSASTSAPKRSPGSALGLLEP
jgi:LuxR family transcriptional regulator, maltose regulon positive regulatory protein